MAVKFIGDVSWRQARQIEWTIDSWGIDHAKVLYRGNSRQKDAFEDSLRKWDGMPARTAMKLAGWTSNIITPSFPGVELEYIGFRNGAVPQAKPEKSLTLTSAQGAGTDTTTGRNVTGTFQYLASRTSWTWYMTTKPPEYCPITEMLDMTHPLSKDRIISYSLQDEETGKPTNRVNYSAFVAIFNSLVARKVVTSYDSQCLFPDSLWACKCDIDYKVL